MQKIPCFSLSICLPSHYRGEQYVCVVSSRATEMGTLSFNSKDMETVPRAKKPRKRSLRKAQSNVSQTYHDEVLVDESQATGEVSRPQFHVVSFFDVLGSSKKPSLRRVVVPRSTFWYRARSGSARP